MAGEAFGIAEANDPSSMWDRAWLVSGGAVRRTRNRVTTSFCNIPVELDYVQARVRGSASWRQSLLPGFLSHDTYHNDTQTKDYSGWLSYFGAPGSFPAEVFRSALWHGRSCLALCFYEPDSTCFLFHCFNKGASVK